MIHLINVAGEDWRKVWRQKRDSFTRKRKELQNLATGVAVHEVRKNVLYDQMTFLIGEIPDYENQR